jgi:uncharacterized protein (TIGR03437 family)
MSTHSTFALFLLAACAGAQAQNVRITWIGQSCFVIQNSEGTPTVITDPPVASVGYALPAQPADVVTISHNHTDHNNSVGMRGAFTLVDGRPITARQEVTAAGMPFVLVPSFHDNQKGAQRGSNAIIRWTQAGIKFAHLGDYGEDQFSEAQLADLRDLDILIVPAGGFYTIDAERAAAFVRQLKPRVAILMHFRTALGGPAQLATLPALATPFAGLVYKPATLTVNRNELPSSTEVWLMEPAAEAVAVNSAGFTAGAPVAPGSLASLFGNFAASRTTTASAFPLPRSLAETEVLVGGNPVPLIYASPAQINFQVPRQSAAGQALVEVRVGGQRVSRGSLTVLPTAPGLFGVLNQDGSLNSPSTPARRGQVIQIYATGQGEVKPVVEDGAAAPGPPLAITPELPRVYLQGRLVPVLFSGLAPGFAGVWQINAVIPQDTLVDPRVNLVVMQGLVSNGLTVAIQ